MADTRYLKDKVEPFVRQELGRRFGTTFTSGSVPLITGVERQFNAVSGDRRIVASVSASGGRTSGGHKPTGKIKVAISELYYLMIACAERRLLVLTSDEFYGIMRDEMTDSLAPDLSLVHIPLPPDIEAEVRRIQAAASKEMSPS